MIESPIIPPSLIRNYPHPRSSPAAAGPREPELHRWKSRVPVTGSSPLVPKPLFSSAKCVVGIEVVAETSELPTSSASPPSPAIPTAANATPISPSPPLFPVPSSTNSIVAGAVSITSSATLQASNSVHSQSITDNTTAAAAARPRPVSSCYSQNTLTTVTATVASSPRSPILPDWSSSIPAGLPSFDVCLAETQTDAITHAQIYAPAHMERVTEEQPVPQHIPVQIQVPRLRSPSLPQDRGSRRRTVPDPVNAVSHGRGRGSSGGWSLIQSSERTIYPEINTVSVGYEESSWPLQKPCTVHSTPQSHEVSRSRVSNISTPESHSYHVANKSSISSSLTYTPGHSEHHSHPPPPDVASPRSSVADSHTPIYGHGEQRSGWWSDDDDVGEARGRNLRSAAIGIKEKLTTDGQGLRARKIKIIAGAFILGILIIVGVAVGVTLGVRRRN